MIWCKEDGNVDKESGIEQQRYEWYDVKRRRGKIRLVKCNLKNKEDGKILTILFLRWGGDSNPRYGYPYGSLANCWFQPLTHLTMVYLRLQLILKDCKDRSFIVFLKINFIKNILEWLKFDVYLLSLSRGSYRDVAQLASALGLGDRKSVV